MLKTIKIKIASLLQGGFFHIFIGNTLVKMIGFISSIVIVRLVDKNEYAYLAYADNLYNYVIAFAGLGMTSAILKYCTSAKTKEEDKAYYVFAMKYGTLFEGVLSVLIIMYVTFATIPFPEAKIIVYILAVYPMATNLLNTTMSYLRAHAENVKYSQSALVQTCVAFVGSVILVSILGIQGIAIARYTAVTVAIICIVKTVRKHCGKIQKKKLNKTEIKGFMAMSISLMIANLFSMIMPINEMTLVNQLLQSEVITANYKIATMIPSQISFITQSIIIYYFTILARKQNKEEVWELSKKVGILSGGIIFIICLCGALLTPWLIVFVYGEQYKDAIILSVVFWIVNGLNAGIRMVPMNFLPAIGIAKFNAIMAAVSCLVHFIIAYIAILKWGIWGAGLSTGIIYIGSGIIYWLYYRRKCME
ncbi:hypothetical protein DWX08_12775 [Ruminococcus sp. AF18-22]|nr:hypothetical protein DWX08_12775 [Ruminococcus sp. AF18-22]